MKRRLRNLQNDINKKRKQNEKDPILAFNRLVSRMKRYQYQNTFEEIPNEFVYDSSCETSIRIQYLVIFYTMDKTFVWAGKTSLERKNLVVDDQTLTIFIARNDFIHNI